MGQVETKNGTVFFEAKISLIKCLSMWSWSKASEGSRHRIKLKLDRWHTFVTRNCSAREWVVRDRSNHFMWGYLDWCADNWVKASFRCNWLIVLIRLVRLQRSLDFRPLIIQFNLLFRILLIHVLELPLIISCQILDIMIVLRLQLLLCCLFIELQSAFLLIFFDHGSPNSFVCKGIVRVILIYGVSIPINPVEVCTAQLILA